MPQGARSSESFVTPPIRYKPIPILNIPAAGVDLTALGDGRTIVGIYVGGPAGTIDVHFDNGFGEDDVREDDFPVQTGALIPGFFRRLRAVDTTNNLWVAIN